MIIKMLVITSMLFSYSVRSPQLDTNPHDYELRTGVEGHANDNNIRFLLNVLFEREEGRKGIGSDVYVKQTMGLNVKHKKYNLQNQFTSYVREVKNINLQTLDSSILYKLDKTNRFGAGVSIAGDYSQQANLYLYFSFENDYIDTGYRTNFDKNIFDLRLRYSYPVNENINIRPSIVYLKNNSQEDYQGNLSLVYKFEKKLKESNNAKIR